MVQLNDRNFILQVKILSTEGLTDNAMSNIYCNLISFGNSETGCAAVIFWPSTDRFHHHRLWSLIAGRSSLSSMCISTLLLNKLWRSRFIDYPGMDVNSDLMKQNWDRIFHSTKQFGDRQAENNVQDTCAINDPNSDSWFIPMDHGKWSNNCFRLNFFLKKYVMEIFIKVTSSSFNHCLNFLSNRFS